MRAVAGGTPPPYPPPHPAMLPARNGPYLSLLRKAPGLRPEPLALHGRDEAPLRCEPPEGPHLRGGRPQARLRLHPLPEGGQGHQGVAGRPPWPIRASFASVASSSVRWPSSRHAATRSTTST